MMASRHGVRARTVRQHLWMQRADLRASKCPCIAATCLVAREFDAPAGVKPIEWRLLTNRTASTLEEALERIEWYRARWEVKILFNILKNACRVEALQLGTIERLERALALFLVVAENCLRSTVSSIHRGGGRTAGRCVGDRAHGGKTTGSLWVCCPLRAAANLKEPK